MTEEEYFRKTYPDSCYGDRPLSPHWDFFQDGVEFGERQSEKKIEELELQLNREKNLNQCMSDHNEQLRELIEKMKADVKQEQSYWNSGEMQYGLLQRLLDKWEVKGNDR